MATEGPEGLTAVFRLPSRDQPFEGGKIVAKVLIVCFSRGGTTLRIARDLAGMIDADVEEIRECASRKGVIGYSRSLIEAVAKGLPTIQTQKAPRDYDAVVIGTPVWAGTMASPIRSYLFLNRQRLPRVAFFATMGGQGAESVLREMKLFCAAEDAPAMFATEAEVHANSYRTKLEPFAAKVREIAPAPQAVSRRSLA